MIASHDEEYNKLIEEYPNQTFYDIFKKVKNNKNLSFVNFEAFGSTGDDSNNKNERIEFNLNSNSNSNSNSENQKKLEANLEGDLGINLLASTLRNSNENVTLMNELRNLPTKDFNEYLILLHVKEIASTKMIEILLKNNQSNYLMRDMLIANALNNQNNNLLNNNNGNNLGSLLTNNLINIKKQNDENLNLLNLLENNQNSGISGLLGMINGINGNNSQSDYFMNNNNLSNTNLLLNLLNANNFIDPSRSTSNNISNAIKNSLLFKNSINENSIPNNNNEKSFNIFQKKN